MPERNWGLRRRRSCLVQAVRLGPGPENGRPRVRGSSEHGGATQLGLGGTPKPHSLRGNGQVPERGRPDPCGWREPWRLLPGRPCLCAWSVPGPRLGFPPLVSGETNGLCKQSDENFKQRRTTGKGRERKKARGPLSSDHTAQCKHGIGSCGPESRAVFRGREKGQPPPTPGPGALRGAGPGPRCLTLGDHGHPESPRRAQTSMLGSLRPGPAPQPPHAMRPGGLSTHLAACVPWHWARRAVRGGREQGVGSEGLGTRAPSSEQEAGERGRSGVRGGGPGGLRGS